ncbi:class I SAM-dependent methyltransferase [Mesorhizobium sp.]|uniref:class I SAM-dependent methyltransferase n=1 Tax=Mesorhizobium sp. TaxID=1871066 RepID=UPI001227F4F2|nr:class I SAM-dependent methyltransferase [Mesorhizobium sp.]TIT00064.1 MAG: class I SAM-dependent methyltransferase [Mesorhizobium sp.]
MDGHQHRHLIRGSRPHAFQGVGSRLYSFFAKTMFRGMYRRLALDIAAAAPQNAAVLDIGTGPGMLLTELAQLRPDLTLTGVDLSPDMVAAAAKNLGGQATIHFGDVTQLPFEDRSFDVVVSSFSMHHWDDAEAAAPQLIRVLRPGGRALIYDFPWAPFEKLNPTKERTPISTGNLSSGAVSG